MLIQTAPDKYASPDKPPKFIRYKSPQRQSQQLPSHPSIQRSKLSRTSLDSNKSEKKVRIKLDVKKIDFA